MPRILVAAFAVVLAGPLTVLAQAGTAAKSAEPFKVGTFLIGTAPTIGIVLRDALVVDLVQANAALEKSRIVPGAAHAVRHGRADRRLRERPQGPHLRDRQRPRAEQGARRQAAALRARARARCRRWRRSRGRGMIMMTAVNFYSHIAENAPPEERAKGDRGAQSQSRRPRTCSSRRPRPSSAPARRSSCRTAAPSWTGKSSWRRSSAAARGTSPRRRRRTTCSATP